MMSTTQNPTTIYEPNLRPHDLRPRRPTERLPQSLTDNASHVDKQDFDADKHVKFVPPAKTYTMEELGLDGQGISPIAISEPFSLFTPEAVQQMRAEIFNEKVLEKHQVGSNFAANMVRGHCPEDAPFVSSVWNSPKVLDAISQVAGIELIPAWDYDIGHANISITGEREEAAHDQALPHNTTRHAEKQEDKVPAIGWHYDSVPFVCVVMLSDCTGMIGGETMIRTGHGTLMKVRGPTMGTAVVMQGRHIEHQALRASGVKDRVSMVTSLRPKSALVKDESVLTGVRGMSYIPELYYQFASYRYQILQERMRLQQQEIRTRHSSKLDFDLVAARQFLMEQRDYIDVMLAELTEV